MLVAAALAGCDLSSASRPCICTNEFRFVTAAVVNESGAAEGDISCFTRNERTGDTLETVQNMGPGTIVVATDANRADVSARGDTLQVVGTKDTRRFDAEFVVKTDPCRCHVWKVAGPDTVVLR